MTFELHLSYLGSQDPQRNRQGDVQTEQGQGRGLEWQQQAVSRRGKFLAQLPSPALFSFIVSKCLFKEENMPVGRSQGRQNHGKMEL